MQSTFKRYVFSFLVIVLSACSRKSSDNSTVQVTLPSAPSGLRKVSSLSAEPNFCYFINVTGSGLSQNSPTCSPAQGTGSGFADPGTTVSLTVSKGTGRSVELYGYVPKNSETCANLPTALANVAVNRLFRLAQVNGVDMSGDTTT